MDQPTATVSLGSILDELKAIIAHSDPQKIAELTPYVQGISPADDAQVILRAGSNDEDKRVSISFCVSRTTEPIRFFPLEKLLENLLLKTPLDELKHLGQVLEHLLQFEGTHFEWGASETEFIEDVGHVCYFFIYKQ